MHYKKRRTNLWSIVLPSFIVAVVVAVVLLWRQPSGDEQQLSPEMPVPVMTTDASIADSEVEVSGDDSLEPAEVPIEPAPPTKIFIPNDDKDLTISTAVKPMEPCQELIDPPRGEGAGDVYYCTDFAMPGTDSEGKTVLAGHASKNMDTWLNRLQEQGDEMVGRQVLLQTEASDNKWLVYTVSNVFEPMKGQLPYMTDVWGEPGQSTSGRLVIVTCLVDASGAVASNNYVVVAELTDVKG